MIVAIVILSIIGLIILIVIGYFCAKGCFSKAKPT
jgi:hypothetical protein